MLFATIVASALMSSVLIYLAPRVVPALEASPQSVHIFYIAVVSNMLMSIFGGNAQFLIFINKIRSLVAIAAIGTIFVFVVGVFLAQFGYQNIVFAYLGETITIVLLSSIVLRRNLSKGASIHFGRYV